jgi:hypothetical protein
VLGVCPDGCAVQTETPLHMAGDSERVHALASKTLCGDLHTVSYWVLISSQHALLVMASLAAVYQD